MEDVPVPIMVEILSRLPVKTIIHCKCVCKKWLDLLSDSYFANLHLSRSPAGLMIHQHSLKKTRGYQPGILKWVEVEDELDHHHLHHDPLMSLDLGLAPIFQKLQVLQVGSVDGLICLWQFDKGKDNTYVCNPITREYMILPLPRPQDFREDDMTIAYCFGVGSATKEYKVIKIFEGDKKTPNPTSSSRPHLLEAEVYTLGTGQWRNLGHVSYFIDGYNGPFLNGHAHWCVADEESPEKLYTFDFDNETFNLFPSPPVETLEGSEIHFKSLAVLRGCLCQCKTFDSQFTIWVMKEYGIKTSWHKEVIIKQGISPTLDTLNWSPVHLIERLNDGTILMYFFQHRLLAYCPERRTFVDTRICDLFIMGLAYCPSFLKLQNFELERVHLF